MEAHYVVLIVVLLFVVSLDGQATTVVNDHKSKAMVGFCESEFYIPKSKTSCPHGITFGKRSPKCICIKGIYRMFFSNCEMADGFAEEVCTLLNDTAFDNRVVAIKLTKEPSWDKTGLAFNRLVSSSSEWDYINEGAKARLSGNTFYSINGEAMISVSELKGGKRKQSICIQKASLKDIICYYRHADNVDKWHIETSTEVMVRPSCQADFKPLVKKRCFNPLTLLDSDCQVPCLKSNLMTSGDGKGETNYDGIPNLEGNCTDPTALFRHENKFIDRQLLMYMVIEQMSKEANVSVPEPTSDGIIKTFKLYDIIKDIALHSCNHPYLRVDVMELASKFFLYLHRANKMKYDIRLSDEDFKWIETILLQCQANMTAFKLYGDSGGECPGTSQLAHGYCVPNTTKNCEYRAVRISPLYSNYRKKHYVPEFIWLFLDIVHMNCFDHFKDAYRMFHVMEQVYEQLFTTPIRDYWHYPTWDEGIKFSMLTVLADVVMWNTQICAESIYSWHEHKLHRLARPTQFQYPTRKKRAAEQISVGYQIGCAKNKNDMKIEGCTEKKSQNPEKGKNPGVATVTTASPGGQTGKS